jgi:hypothetical protein
MWGGELASLKEPKFFSRLRQNYGNLPLCSLMSAFDPNWGLGFKCVGMASIAI